MDGSGRGLQELPASGGRQEAARRERLRGPGHADDHRGWAAALSGPRGNLQDQGGGGPHGRARPRRPLAADLRDGEVGGGRDMEGRLGRILISHDEITVRVAELGEAIRRDYAGRAPVLVGVLKGAVIFAADLIRAIPLPVSLDFMSVSSYGGGTRSSGVVSLTADLSVSIEGRDVIIVEDIIDTGRTISYLRRNLATRHPRSLALCVLLDKVSRREVEVAVDYIGFAIPDEFVVGYGLDHDGLHRNLRHIARSEERRVGTEWRSRR